MIVGRNFQNCQVGIGVFAYQGGGMVLQGAPVDPAIDLSWQGPGLPEEPFGVEVLSGQGYASYLDLPLIGDGGPA